jgi:hypothetical protein
MHRSSVISPRNGGIPSDSSTSLAAAAAGGGGHPHGSTSPLQPHGSIPLSSHPSTAAMLATQGSAPPGLVMTGHLHDSSHLALQGASALSARAGPKGLDIAVQAISTIAHLRSSTAAAAEAAASAHAAASAASLADIIGGGGAVIVGGTCWRELKMGAPPSAAKRNRRLSSTHGAGRPGGVCMQWVPVSCHVFCMTDLSSRGALVLQAYDIFDKGSEGGVMSFLFCVSVPAGLQAICGP